MLSSISLTQVCIDMEPRRFSIDNKLPLCSDYECAQPLSAPPFTCFNTCHFSSNALQLPVTWLSQRPIAISTAQVCAMRIGSLLLPRLWLLQQCLGIHLLQARDIARVSVLVPSDVAGSVEHSADIRAIVALFRINPVWQGSQRRFH